MAAAERLVSAMRMIPEARAFQLATPELAFAAVRDALIATADGTGANNPVVIGRAAREGETFSVKSGAAAGRRLAGAKIGSFWPSNDTRGLPRHSAVVVLLDPDSGRAMAVVEGGRMNGRRTAAADAVAVDRLARPEARTLSILGAGAQARYEAEALVRVRNFERILIASRDPERARAATVDLAGLGPRVEVADVRAACEAAEVLVTATPSRAALFEADWIGPGTHISAMGADQVGKQELPEALLARAKLFADCPAQSLALGEFQRLVGGAKEITALGDVLRGVRPGRMAASEITVFDSSGLALQDLFVAAAVLDAA